MLATIERISPTLPTQTTNKVNFWDKSTELRSIQTSGLAEASFQDIIFKNIVTLIMEYGDVQVVDPGAYCVTPCDEVDISFKSAPFEGVNDPPPSFGFSSEPLYEAHEDFSESTPSEATLDTATNTVEDSVCGAAESLAGDPIYIGVVEDRDQPSNSRADDDDDDLELTDDELDAPEEKDSAEPEEEGPPAPLPLPQEHIYIQDPRQPLLLRDFHVLKTLGKNWHVWQGPTCLPSC
ncbi:uncharacterized protein EI90DRAFT_2666096 [Cantharellus anzutake]|uniref:uncharacterized protein n=1 Tax=Cantharellus anzutake TaxID=1750568 RepID=UPI001905DEB5|nr:uncharacterized protein EI90DRAFT_2666096 [Cantharellus anzutake]KAF8337570.1 hypothetical protein EI90DRAFT_2666096 [Cantharellus anzutake]